MNIEKRLKHIDSCTDLFKKVGFEQKDIDDLKELYINKKKMEFAKKENSLKMDYNLPIIYIDKDIFKSILDKFDNTKEYDEKVVQNAKHKKGYIIFNMKDLVTVNLPQTNEDLIYAVQHENGLDALEGMKRMKEEVANQYERAIIYFDFTSDKCDYTTYLYRRGIDCRISANAVDYKNVITDLIKDEAEDKLMYNINFKLLKDDHGEIDGCGVEIEEDLVDANTVIFSGICAKILYLISQYSLDDYQLTKENLNTKVKKDNNYKIDLNREIKQILKKNNTSIYYIGKADE